MILDFIKKEVKEKGYPPSVREIGEAMGLASSSTVHGHLARLEKKGLIHRDPTKPRALELLDYEMDSNKDFTMGTARVPVIGMVTAGEPILAVEKLKNTLSFLKACRQWRSLYATNPSMIDAAILDRDYVIVRQQATALNGEIIVAMTEENERQSKGFSKKMVTLGFNLRTQPWSQLLFSM